MQGAVTFSHSCVSFPLPIGYLAEDVLNVDATQLVVPRVQGTQDGPETSCQALVTPLVTTAKGLVVRAKLQGKGRPEGRPVVQTLGMALQPVHLGHQECETKTRNARRGRVPGGPPPGCPPSNGPPLHLLQGKKASGLPLGLQLCAELVPSLLRTFLPFPHAPSSWRWFLGNVPTVTQVALFVKTELCPPVPSEKELAQVPTPVADLLGCMVG